MKDGRALWLRLDVAGKILIVFLALSMVSLIIIGSIAFITICDVGDYALESGTSLGNRVMNDSTAALENDAEEYLLRLAKDQAAISDTLFEKVEAETNIMAQFALNILSDSSLSIYNPTYSQYEIPEDIYTFSSYKAAPDTDIHALREELRISSNMDDIFIPIYNADPHLTWVYIGTESGFLRIYPWYSGYDPTYDPRIRDFYLNAKETGNISWTDPYIDAAGQGLMVSCSKPVYSPDNNWFWVVGADVTIETINRDIINTQIGELGYALLIDSSGNVIARPGLSTGDTKWDESFETENLLDSNNTELRAIAENMTAGHAGIARCRFEGGEKYIAFAPINSTNWSVGLVMPVEEIIAPALATKSKIISATQDTEEHINDQLKDIKKLFIIILISMVFVVSGLSFSLARIITKPVMTLKEGSEALGRGDLDHLVEVKTGDEFEELGNSFNQMASDLKEHMDELRRTTAEKERMAKELDIARGIQQSFLPDSIPKIEGIDLAAFNLPANEVGGDFYDFIPITKDKWGLVIADVSGKGVPAALFMALSRTIIRAGATGNPCVADVIEEANKLIVSDADSGMFVTLFYAILDREERSLTYVNAGHNPPMVFNSATGDHVVLEAEGIPLGVMEDTELEERKIEMKSGDLVIFYTDGVTEAVDDKDRLFGEERLVEIIRDLEELSANDVIEKINSEVLSFCKNVQQFDDITLIVLKVE
jgi:sigma-B regulation protein RsbU (phosphoserine phosphatase)